MTTAQRRSYAAGERLALSLRAQDAEAARGGMPRLDALALAIAGARYNHRTRGAECQAARSGFLDGYRETFAELSVIAGVIARDTADAYWWGHEVGRVTMLRDQMREQP